MDSLYQWHYSRPFIQYYKKNIKKKINNKKEKRFPIHAKEALDELYKDYKAEDGNSYIDKYYARMCTWEAYDDELYM